MIAIPNMEMLKSCNECHWYYERYDEHCTLGKFLLRKYTTDACEEPYTLNTQRHPNCPLIEIDLVRCGECKWFINEGSVTICDTHETYIEPTDFCSYGERRADEN